MRIVLIGDIHMSLRAIEPLASAAVDRLDRTTIVNARALRDGGYIIVDGCPDGLHAELRYVR